MRHQLKRRLRSLWVLELANAVLLFPLLYLFVGSRYRLGWFSLVALVMVCANLAVGASFWYLKAKALERSDALARPATRRFYRASKIAFGAALPVLLVLFVGALARGALPLAELIVGGLLFLMAVLEYVNYYHVQLMYDNRADLEYLLTHRHLKRGIMVRELGI